MLMKDGKKAQSDMPLTLELRNYRAFKESRLFPIAPLTCLVGANSSGKSSIISALLLLKQSIERDVVAVRGSPLTLNGVYCTLGNFSDVVFGNNESEQIEFTISIPIGIVKSHHEKSSGPIVAMDIPQSPLMQPRPWYLRRGFFDPVDLRMAKEDDMIEISLCFSDDQPFGPSLSEFRVSHSRVGSARFVRTIKGERQQHWRSYVYGLPRKSVYLEFNRYNFLPRIFLRDRGETKGEKQSTREFVRSTAMALSSLETMLAESYAIGPFRTSPERTYNFGGFGSTKGGGSGERTVDLLITENLLSPNSSPLLSAVSYWLKHLGLASKLDIDTISKEVRLFALSLKHGRSVHAANIADMGYGLSQILPVIVQGLLMRPGGIYMVQQPELHLHPDAQAALADFFLFLASKGIRVVAETHSEYLLIRLRRRLAEGQVKPAGKHRSAFSTFAVRSDDVAILLTEQKKGAGSAVKRLTMNVNFQLENMPEGFMNQAMEDRLALLKEVARRGKQK